MKFNMIAAIDNNNGIGYQGQIPWFIPQDLKYFQDVTSETSETSKTSNKNKKKINVVIMGRLTWESIPKKYRPLKNRLNLIISSQKIDDHNSDLVFKTLDDILFYLETENNKFQNIDKIFIVGGQRMYEEGIKHKDCERLYITHIDKEYQCDKFFPKIDTNIYKVENESDKYITKDGIKYIFTIYKKS